MVALALLVAMIAGAICFRELEFVTAALVTALAGVAVDVRQTKKLARVRT